MATGPVVPETRVLAIASHVVFGYVGNKMVSFVLMSLGCNVSAINTVNYSNHTGYKQVKGTKTTAEQIRDLYDGLKQSDLNNFDVLLSGYLPSAEAVQTVGRIGRELKFNAGTKPGSFFWVLDPVMGDEGRLYIPEDEVPQYKNLLREADLILPNQFEAELLSDTKITDLTSLGTAIQILHRTYQVPHIIITSLVLSATNKTLPSRPPSRMQSSAPTPRTATPERNAATSHPSTWPTSESKISPQQEQEEEEYPNTLTIIGSTATSTHTARLFRIDVPAHSLYFSGTGDMFAALTVARLREAIVAANLQNTASWKSPDDVAAADLPLAQATSKVLASMQAVLAKTAAACAVEMEAYDERVGLEGAGSGEEAEEDRHKKRGLRLSRAAEVRVVRNVGDLVSPPNVEKFKARAVEVDVEKDGVGDKGPGSQVDQLGVRQLALGGGEGAVQLPVPQDKSTEA
ncbi:Ribokinase-like protein [Mytilinidion resinicola]|uniref:pyridoxal kinase n=1 Tax=Mytilinidion resinicola TaxID=574789 RepID=A0A6A6YDW3_9PEZI|nr:Ribokinase-like protein [Mytilinidion resinicola]KAF2806920.1 Ribokinase-like protein [Mytilinidion resinicola]